MVDSAALDEITASITGADGVLASTARHLLGQLGLADQAVLETGDDLDAELVKLVETELGSDWARKVSPSFDANDNTLTQASRSPFPARSLWGAHAVADPPTGQ